MNIHACLWHCPFIVNSQNRLELLLFDSFITPAHQLVPRVHVHLSFPVCSVAHEPRLPAAVLLCQKHVDLHDENDGPSGRLITMCNYINRKPVTEKGRRKRGKSFDWASNNISYVDCVGVFLFSFSIRKTHGVYVLKTWDSYSDVSDLNLNNDRMLILFFYPLFIMLRSEDFPAKHSQAYFYFLQEKRYQQLKAFYDIRPLKRTRNTLTR